MRSKIKTTDTPEYNLTEIIREYYNVDVLPESERKLYYLIDRYSDKVSERLRKKKQELYSDGEKRFNEMLLDLMKRPNPFLQLLSEELPPNGAYYPVPIN